MKKPWTRKTEAEAKKPTIDDVLESFANEILDNQDGIDSYFEITIEEES